ncbi:CBP80/20-dependent translation initiation factor-like isoform X9 [Amphibalanus amphitrite]|uniref:CBP80/20-dependent translation initiation factor-like isoform X9 n=1 Tax=Amphibalanus amphitrite TaxID=1232801 RepID=UPI001C900C4A|nr:CBP80/20-dependent translation initiation factor-like isoform X9 [Amphibalanus amphitrite]
MESNKKEQQGYPMRRERSFHVHPSRAEAAGFAALRRERSFANPAPPFHVGGRDPRRRSGMPAMRGKPAMELYRPPTMRSPGFVAACPAVNGFNGSPEAALAAAAAPTAAPAPLNINAKEFQPVSAAAGGGDGGGSPSKQPPPLLRSKSSKDARSLKVTFRSGGAGDAPAPSDDATNHDKRTAEPAAAAVTVPPVPGGLKRSRSLGAELLPAPAGRPEPVAGAAAALGHFSPDVQALLAQAVQEPGRLTGRQTMDLVRHVFTRLVEAARYGEPAARLCLAIIERERTETFLETLLNTCQEWYQQRDRLLRPHQSTFGNGFVPASPRWIAFITFVNELYALLKRRQVATGSRPRAGSAVQILLELLAESCQVTLRAPSVNSLAETECVFLILTSIGRDLEQESPAQLERIMAAVRDALINCSLISAVSKTLLQLVELQAARWQLPANTVMYYYPMSAK